MSMDEAARSRAPELDRLVGRNLRQIREELDLSQTDVSEGMAAAGFPGWRKATVADVERGARKVALDELASLCDVTEQPLERLLTPDVELSSEAQRRSKLLTGRVTPKTPEGLYDITVERMTEKLEAFLCAELGLDADELTKLCEEMYGHPGLWLERERRVHSEDTHPAEIRARRKLERKHPKRALLGEVARRGHATRAMLAEMREWLDAERTDTRGTK